MDHLFLKFLLALQLNCNSYGSGWGFSKLHALVGLKPTMGDFPANCFMNPQVIATLADWAILLPCVYGDISRPPRIVFVHHLMLPHFVRYILPNIPVNHRFVLVSSGSDQTIPTGAGDVRFHPLLGFSSKPEGGPNWKLLTNHPQIIHWFCENHDLAHPNVSTLPVGVVEGVGGMKHVNMTASTVPILERPLKFLVLHRSRNGRGPWVLRAQIQELCLQQQEEHLPSHVLCLSPGRHVQRDTRKGVPLKEYIEFAHNVTFILCVKGGGLDPSPKAWEAIMLGSIPVIQHSTLDDAYQHLPVVFINDWNKLFDSPKLVRLRLQALREKLAPYYSDPVMRAMVLDVSRAASVLFILLVASIALRLIPVFVVFLQRLTMSFWEERIESTYRDQRPPPLSVLAVDF